MTAIAIDAPRVRNSTSSRILNVVMLHTTNPWTTIILPWLITLAIFGLNYAIWALVSRAAGPDLEADAFANNGGVTWILVYMMVVAIQAMSASFRFALGMSVTRRDYYLGSALYFVILSAVYAAGFTALGWIERVTNGWGVGGYFFAPFGSDSQPLWLHAYAFLVLLLMFFFVGAASAGVWMRWKVSGLLTELLGIAVILVGLAWWVTEASAWGTVGEFFTGNSPFAILSWTLPVTVGAGLAGFALLRRATP
jgi:hypothetical protein